MARSPETFSNRPPIKPLTFAGALVGVSVGSALGVPGIVAGSAIGAITGEIVERKLNKTTLTDPSQNL